MKSGRDRAANLELVDALVRRAAGDGSSLIVLPELFSWRGPQDQELENSEPIPGPSYDTVAALALELGVFIVAGSLLERGKDSDTRCFNTCVFFGPGGEELARYRKIHLFDVDLPGEVTVRESLTRQAGAEVICVATELATVGLSICYDLRFPELYRRLAGSGAEVLVVPSAFTKPTGEAHWETLVRARAIENQAWVVAANQYGASTQQFADYGHSMIVDPWGRVLREANDEEAVLSAELSGELLDSVRRELPCAQHRVFQS